MKIRIQFEKLGTVRFTSHKDVVRMFERAFAAAAVPVAWSEGFHPHMRMSFGPPLRTGWESREEYMDITMEDASSAVMDGFAAAVNEKLPEGLVIRRVVAIDDRTPKLASDMSAVSLEVSVAADDAGTDADAVSSRISNRFLNNNHAETEPRVSEADVVRSQDALRIRYTSTMQNGRIVTPEDVVSAAIGDPESFRVPIKVVRLAQFVARGDRLVSPLDEGVVQASV
ncbi:MAG TPA: TIGR03936 family radical SAM-associated protein [Candidatus Krumholzibacteria bacterium]|nr:TIGR03936 family radical SAM-associated protein [Candidatus Krumholzibacteria bacterium]